MDNQYAVYEQHRKCQDSFSQLFNAILDHGSGSKSELAEEYDKYKVWVSNTGASNGGADWELSLDFRLQEASFLKSQVRATIPQDLPNIRRRAANPTCCLRLGHTAS